MVKINKAIKDDITHEVLSDFVSNLPIKEYEYQTDIVNDKWSVRIEINGIGVVGKDANIDAYTFRANNLPYLTSHTINLLIDTAAMLNHFESLIYHQGLIKSKKK